MSAWLIHRLFGSNADIGLMTGFFAGLVVGNGVVVIVVLVAFAIRGLWS